MSLAEMMPDSVSTLLACCYPTPPLIHLFSTDIVRLIQITKTKSEELYKAKLDEIESQKVEQLARAEEWAKSNTKEPIHTRFDSSERKRPSITSFVSPFFQLLATSKKSFSDPGEKKVQEILDSIVFETTNFAEESEIKHQKFMVIDYIDFYGVLI